MRDFSSMRMIIRKIETENLPCLPVRVFFILFSQPIVSNMGIFIDRWPALADLVASSLRLGTTNHRSWTLDRCVARIGQLASVTAPVFINHPQTQPGEILVGIR